MADQGFGGSGWDFPVRLADDGTIAETATGADAIRNAIRTILGTAPGERVMRPDFGCGIEDRVFAVNDARSAGTLAATVAEALMDGEPRIDVLDVRAAPDPERPDVLSVEVEYRTRTDNSRLNLVYPFYLE